MKKRSIWFSSLLLIILIALPYLQMRSHEFINWDDPFYIYNNPLVTAGLSWMGVGWAFVTGVTANWHPLTWLSHMLDSSLFGAIPSATLMVNMIWYMGYVILIFLFLLHLGVSVSAAFFMAAFFGLHPLHVESVAWASERKDLLCAFFFLAATITYLHYTREKKMSVYLLTTALFVLSLLSKPMAVTWPVVALLLDYWPLKRFSNTSPQKILYEKIPWISLSFFSSVITVIVQNKNDAIKSFVDFPFSDRLANAAISYWIYIRQTVWPSELTVFYPYPYYMDSVSAVAAGLTLGIMTIIVFRQRQIHPYLLWGWLFYLGVLFPVIGLVQIGGHAHADRYTLIPQLGLILGMGIFMDRAIPSINCRRITAVILAIIICLLMILTFRQVSYWKNNKTLFNQNLAVAGQNELAHFNLGVAYLENNEPELAVIHLSAAAEMNSEEVSIYNNLGIAYTRLDKLSLAETCLKQAIILNPQIAQPYFHLAVIKVRQGKLNEAIKYLNEAVQRAPNWEEAINLLNKMNKLSSNQSFKANEK